MYLIHFIFILHILYALRYHIIILFLCYSGPNNAEFATVNESITNITKLTKGDYVFKLTVVDDNGNADSDTVNVKVTQSTYL